MLPIIIIEDNDSYRKQIEGAIKDFSIVEGLDVDVVLSTGDPYKCIDYLDRNINIQGLYFIDIDLGNEIDGIELGKYIKVKDPNGRIVMVTTEGAFAFFTFMYRLEVLDYIVKDSIETVIRNIRKCVKIAYERNMERNSTERGSIDIKIGSQIRSIPIEEVCFIETSEQEHHLILHTKNSKIEFRGYMRVYTRDNPILLRTHRAYLVNMENALEFDEERRILKMVNGELCYVSMRKKNAVKDILTKSL